MLTVTEAASARFAGMLSELRAPSDAAIRMVLEPSGLRIRVDRPAPHDLEFKHQGRTVLILDRHMSQILAHKKVDLEQRNGTARLAMIWANPWAFQTAVQFVQPEGYPGERGKKSASPAGDEHE